jgi:hypothetical protein
MRVLALGAVVGCVTYSITRSVLFAAFRHRTSLKGYLWERGVKCPFCTSHWVALVATLVFAHQLPQITGAPIFDGPYYVFLLAWVSMLAMGLMGFAMRFIPKMKEGYIHAEATHADQ